MERVGTVQLGLAHDLTQALAAQEARRAAVRSLCHLPRAKEAEVVSVMVALATGDEDAEVREAALGVLSKYWRRGQGAAGAAGMGIEDRLRPVLICLNDADERVELAALDALECLVGGRKGGGVGGIGGPPQHEGAAKMVVVALSHFLFPPSSPDALKDAGTLGANSHYDFAAARLRDAAAGFAGGEESASAGVACGGMSQAVLAAAVKMLVWVAGADMKLVVRGALQALRQPAWHVRRAACRVLQSLFARTGASSITSPTHRLPKMAQALLDQVTVFLRHADDGVRSAGVQAVAALCPNEMKEEGEKDGWRQEVADKVAAQLVHAASFRSEERRRGVRSAVVSALLCLGAPPAALALRRVIISASSAASAATGAALAMGVQPSGAAIVNEGVAALAELSSRTVPGAREAAMRAAAVTLEESKGGHSGEFGGTGTGAHMTVDQTLVLQRIALAQLVSVMTESHRASRPDVRQGAEWVSLNASTPSSAPARKGWEWGGEDKVERSDEFTNRRALERYTRGPWVRGEAKRIGSAAGASLVTAEGGAVASTQRQDEVRIEVMLKRGLHESLYPVGHPYHKSSAAAAKVVNKFRAAMQKIAVLNIKPTHKQADEGVAAQQFSFVGECARIEASLLPLSKQAEWRLSRQRLEKAEGLLEQRRRAADQAAGLLKIQPLEALLKRWEDKKLAAAGSNTDGDGAGKRLRQDEIDKRIKKLKERLQHAQARAVASANAAAVQKGIADAEAAVLEARSAEAVAQKEAAAVAAQLANASNKVVGRSLNKVVRRSLVHVGGEDEANAGDEDELMREPPADNLHGTGHRVVVRGVFLCARARGRGGAGPGRSPGADAQPSGDAKQPVAEGEEEEEDEEERIEFVVCDFGCSPELHAQQPGKFSKSPFYSACV